MPRRPRPLQAVERHALGGVLALQRVEALPVVGIRQAHVVGDAEYLVAEDVFLPAEVVVGDAVERRVTRRVVGVVVEIAEHQAEAVGSIRQGWCVGDRGGGLDRHGSEGLMAIVHRPQGAVRLEHLDAVAARRELGVLEAVDGGQ